MNSETLAPAAAAVTTSLDRLARRRAGLDALLTLLARHPGHRAVSEALRRSEARLLGREAAELGRVAS